MCNMVCEVCVNMTWFLWWKLNDLQLCDDDDHYEVADDWKCKAQSAYQKYENMAL